MACAKCDCSCESAPRNVVNVTVDPQPILDALLRLKQQRGGGDLGLA